MSDFNKQFTIIVRSAGERTESAASWLVGQVVGPDNVHVVKAGPLSRTFSRSVEIGIESRREWTLFLDADVLIDAAQFQAFLREANKHPESVFALTGRVYDKIFRRIRRAGVKIYRTGLLKRYWEKGVKDISEARPDSNATIVMANDSFPTINLPVVVGLHDFEQNYIDLFKKCFMHGHKHRSITGRLIQLWTRYSETDLDYQVAIWGGCSALLYPRKDMSDARNAPLEIYQQLMNGRPEKDLFEERENLGRLVDDELQTALEAERRSNRMTEKIRRRLVRAFAGKTRENEREE